MLIPALFVVQIAVAYMPLGRATYASARKWIDAIDQRRKDIIDRTHSSTDQLLRTSTAQLPRHSRDNTDASNLSTA
ncbi:hypothetical protein MRX96_003581 [Rhipicephalus microplus]